MWPRSHCPMSADQPAPTPRASGDEGGGHGSGALAAAGEAQPVGRGGRDGHRSAERRREYLLGLRAARTDLRCDADDLDGDVADLVPGGTHQPGRLGEQRYAGRPRPLRTGRAEVAAKVAEARRRPQSVTGGMSRDVTVGVTGEARRTLPAEPGDPARTVGIVGVDVRPDADTRHCALPDAEASNASARIRSNGVVTFSASVRPGTVCTATPIRSTSAASSVAAWSAVPLAASPAVSQA